MNKNAHRLSLAEQVGSVAVLVLGLFFVGWLSERSARTEASVFSR